MAFLQPQALPLLLALPVLRVLPGASVAAGAAGASVAAGAAGASVTVLPVWVMYMPLTTSLQSPSGKKSS